MTTKLPREMNFAPSISFKEINGEGTKQKNLGDIFYTSIEEALKELLVSVDQIERLCPEGYEPEGCQIVVGWNAPFRVGAETKRHYWSIPEEKLAPFRRSCAD